MSALARYRHSIIHIPFGNYAAKWNWIIERFERSVGHLCQRADFEPSLAYRSSYGKDPKVRVGDIGGGLV